MISHYIPTIIRMIPPYHSCFYHFFYRRGHEGRWRCPNCRNARFSTPLRICPKRAINIEKQKENGRHYGQLLEERSMVSHVLIFFGLLELFATLVHKCQNPWKNKKEKQKKFHPMSLVQLLRPSLGVETFCYFLFSGGFGHLESPCLEGKKSA